MWIGRRFPPPHVHPPQVLLRRTGRQLRAARNLEPITRSCTFLLAATFAVFSITAFAAESRGSARQTLSFDAGWRFLKADAADAEKPEFDDAAWRALDVPHDWSIEGPFAQTNKTGGAGGFLPSGIGWYRKHFTLPGRCRGSPRVRRVRRRDGQQRRVDQRRSSSASGLTVTSVSATN